MKADRAKSDVAAAYNEWAETYDVDQNRTRDLAGEALRQTDLQIAGRRVVEVGCGTGRNTIWLAQQAAALLAMDFSEEMLARARAKVQDRRVRFVQHDARQRWPLEDNSADTVIAMLILEHVEQLSSVFVEAARVLVPGGEFFVCELHPMRQLTGGQAQFSNTKTGERQMVTAFIHDASEYVNTALSVGFELKRLDEWRDAGAPLNSFPRLLSLLVRSRS
jgi:ubiquinone/menaquinone biosynthesis C-methylase UbiE